MTIEKRTPLSPVYDFSEAAAELSKKSLVTRSSLVQGLRSAGIVEGDTVLLHSALSELGFVVGAAQTIVDALLDTIGSDGTIMMPTYSGELSDPADWCYPPVPEEWIEPIRNEMPGYDPDITPTRRMGSIAEFFRNYPGAIRSPHPQSSFSAIGRWAQELVGEHPLDFRFGPKSPLGKLYDLAGKSILLGALPQTCSLYYLTEFFVERTVSEMARRSPIMRNGAKEWVSYADYDYANFWFNEATDDLVDSAVISKFQIGDATSYVLPARETVDAVVAWRKERGI